MSDPKQTIRIFISSPGDVSRERDRAREVIEGLRRRYARRFVLKAVLWEEMPLPPDKSFQKGIDAILSEEGPDIAVFILWSRMGSPPGHEIVKEGGGAYRSGTEREFDLMIQARKQALGRGGKERPDMLVYTRRDDASFGEILRAAKDTQEQSSLVEQKKLVECFLNENFRDSRTGVNIGAYFAFDQPTTFSQRLRAHLTALLDSRAGDMDSVIWDIFRQGPPFLGLDSFQPEHADIFHGREEEILEARNALKQKAQEGGGFLLLSGASGSGKSSIARAGILPEILAQELDERIARWLPLIATPSELGGELLEGLLARLATGSLLPDLVPAGQSVADLARDLVSAPDAVFRHTIGRSLENREVRHGGGVRILMVLDQLEELFSGGVEKDARGAFLAVLEACVRSGLVWVIATVRSDFYPHLQTEPVLVRLKQGRGTMDIMPPGADALQRMIEEPARLSGLEFEQREGTSLAGLILREAASHAELLPLLEFVLLELFEKRTPENMLTFAEYEHSGGVEGALSRRAEATYEALPPEARLSLAQVLQALVTLGEGAGGGMETPVRRHAPLRDFGAGTAANLLVTRFVEARLLTAGAGQDKHESTVTLAHESLLRVWPRAVEWRQQNEDLLRTRARVEARIREGSPLSGEDPLFKSAAGFLTTSADSFSAEQQAWIRGAIAKEEVTRRSAARRRNTVLLGLASLAVLALIAAGLAAVSSSVARKERDSRRDQQALAERRAEDASRARYASDINLVQTLYEQKALVRARRILEATESSYREFEFGYLQSRINPCIGRTHVDRPLLDIFGSDSPVPTLGIASEGIFSISQTNLPDIRWNRPVDWARFAGLGKWAVGYSSESPLEIQVCDLGTGKIGSLKLPAEMYSSHPAVSRDGAIIAVMVGGGPKLVLYDLSTMRESESLDLTDYFNPRAEYNITIQGRRVIVQPGRSGTGNFPDNPSVYDVGCNGLQQIRTAETKSVGEGVDLAEEIEPRLIAFSLEESVGVFFVPPPPDSADETTEAASDQVIVEKLPFPVEEIVAIAGTSCFAVRDRAHQLFVYSADAKSREIRRIAEYGGSDSIHCISPSASGKGVYIGSLDGTVQYLPLNVGGAGLSANPTEIDMGSNSGWACRIEPFGKPRRLGLLTISDLGEEFEFGAMTIPTPTTGGPDLGQLNAFTHPLIFMPNSVDRGWDDLSRIPQRGLTHISSIPVLTSRRFSDYFEGKDSKLSLSEVKLPEGAKAYAISSDGTTTAFQAGSSISVVDSRIRLEVPDQALLCGISSRGTCIAARAGDKVWLMNPADPGQRVTIETRGLGDDRRGLGVAFDPDGRRCALWIDDSTIGLVDTATGHLLLSLDASCRYPGGDVRFSSDGKILWTKRSYKFSSMLRETWLLIWGESTIRQMAEGEP